MANNKTLPPAGPGEAVVVATEEIGGVDYQLVKVVEGTPASTTPVTPLTDTQLRASPIAALPATGGVQSGATTLTPKYAFANVAASQTGSSIVAIVATKKIRVLAVVAVCGATATDLTFLSKPAGAGTAISALFANGINGGVVLPFNPLGWFETVAGEGLACSTGAGSTTGISAVYVEV